MRQFSKRFCALLLLCAMLLGLCPGLATLAAAASIPNSSEARVTSVKFGEITDGSAPWDADDAPGNDSGADNKIVRSFDTVNYSFNVEVASTDTAKAYTEAYVCVMFTLPLSSAQAEFDTAAMAWMENSGKYAYRVTEEGGTQTLVAYKHLENDGKTVVPGTFGENLTVRVKGMANSAEVKPAVRAYIDGAAEADQTTAVADTVTVSAAPSYNIKVKGNTSYKDSFNFKTGNPAGSSQPAANYGIAGDKLVPGRLMNFAVCLELYNNKPDKGFKGIEIPNGSPITFKLRLSSKYRINTPNADSGYTAGQEIAADAAGYMPLLYSADGNMLQPYGTANGDGRVLYDATNAVVNGAPYNVGGEDRSCFNGGTWSAVQLRNEDGTPTGEVLVTVSGYEINVDKMPTMDGDRSSEVGAYGADKGIGVFSAGEFWVVQPFNQLGNDTTDSAQYQIIQEYGQGAFYTTATASDLTLTTVNGTVFADTAGTNDHQQIRDDDVHEAGLELTLPGVLQNRVFYAGLEHSTSWGVNVENQRHGDDVAVPGTELYLRAGFTYYTSNEENNRLWFATNFLRFPAAAYELTGEFQKDFIDGADRSEATLTVKYGAKTDGTDWTSFDEMRDATEDQLVYYDSLDALQNDGKTCVAVLLYIQGPGLLIDQKPHYGALMRARVRDTATVNQTYSIVSTSRVWTKAMCASSAVEAVKASVNPGEDGTYATPSWETYLANRATLLTENHFTNTKGKTEWLNSGNIPANNSAGVPSHTQYVPATYDEAHVLHNHNSDWGHWGDTMLIIGYKTGVSMVEAQRVNGKEKETYALDRSQREADFAVQPTASFDKSQGTPQKTTDLTITVTLPKYLSYIDGSSYFGGTYTQSSANGGTRGTVTDGRELPPTVTAVLDEQGIATGETQLVWTLEGVAVGQEIPPIYYSTFIGSKLPDADCPQGTTSLAPTVTISGTEDNRAFTAENGNLATEGITVTKSSANAFTKSVKADTVEADGTVDYEIYSSNNATDPDQVYLLDTMPFDGQNGSTFAGTYHVTAWKLDTTLCDASKLSVYYTLDEQYSSATAATVPQATAQSWTQATIGPDGTLTDMNGKRPTAWAIIGSLDSNKAINIELQIQLEPDLSAFKDNTTYVNTISSGELRATAAASVVKRSISGMAWSDDDADGRKNETADPNDTRCAGTTFYTGTGDKHDPVLFLKKSLYENTAASDLKQLKVVMSGSPNSVDPIKLYFRTDNKGWAEGNRFEINNPTLVKNGGEKLSQTEKEYVFDLDASVNANWTGMITELRLDPLEGNSLSFNIKSITLVKADGSEQVLDFCTKGACENYVTFNSSVLPGVSYPTAEDYTLPQEAILSTKRPGATYTAADDGKGDLIFTFLETMYVGLSASDLKAVRVVASGDPKTENPMKLYYAAGNDNGLFEGRMIEAGNVAWDEKNYTFDLASRSDWTGAIHALRLDPIQGANLNVTLKSIMLDLADGTTRTFDFTVPGATEQFLCVTNSQGAPVYTADTGDVTRDSVKVSLYRKGETGGTTFDTGNGNGDAILTANEVMYQGLNTSDVKSVRFVMSGDSDSVNPPQLFYMSGSDKNFSGEKMLPLNSNLRLSKDMKEYVFEMSSFSNWKPNEKLTGLRFDPLQNKNKTFTIRSITIELTDGTQRCFDFTTKDAYQNYVTLANLPTVSYAEADGAYVPVTDSNYRSVSTHLGRSINVKNPADEQDYTSGSYEFRGLSGGTYMVRMESGTTDLGQFDCATNAESVRDANGKLVAAELRGIEVPSTTEDFSSDGHDIGFYGKTTVVLNYDRKVTVGVRSFRNDPPTVEVADAVDATVWSSKLEKTDSKGRTVTFAEVGADGNVTITPYDLIYSKDNPDATVFYRVSYPDGTSVVHEIVIKPADVIYYEESNDDLMTFTDGQRGKWYKVTGQYRHDITADAADYDANANGQHQDADSHTDDYDSMYSQNGNNLYFSAGTARMVNVTSAIKDETVAAGYPSVQFTFFGTGFELVSMGTPYGGVVNVQVYEGDREAGEKPYYTRTVNTRYGIYYGEDDDGGKTSEGRETDRLYQGTALVKDDLTYGKYTVVCTPMYSKYFDPYNVGSFDILVDGVRILNPIGTAPEYDRTAMNDILTSGVSLFITEYGKTELSDKLEHGPKYEIHLAPQQSIAVSVTAKAGATLRMGAQSYTGAAGELSVYSVKSFTDDAVTAPISQKTLTGTEMHYPVYTAGSAGTQILLFKNTGKANISLTSFEYLPGTVTKLCCQPEDTNAALGLANALLTPEEVTDPHAGSLGIRGASLTLSSDISINFYVPKKNVEGYENPYLLCTKQIYDKKGSLVGTEELKLTGRRENGDNWVYTYTGIAAKEMGSLVTATVHGTKDGKEYAGKSLEYSVKQYAYNKLKADTTDGKFKTMLIDMLNYGAAAQEYWGYNPKNLVNAELTDEQKTHATQTDPALTDNRAVSGTANGLELKGITLLMQEKIAIKYYFTHKNYTGKMSDLTMKVTYVDSNGQTQTSEITGDKFTTNGDSYAVVFDELNPTQLHTVCTAEVFDKDGKKVSQTVTYSAESYAARKLADGKTNEKFAKLLREMMKYGDSSAKYFGVSTKQVRTPRQAYEICYSYSLDQAKNLEGITSGWQVDNRAGLGKVTNTNNGVISDVKTDEHSRLLRYFNNETAGRFDLRYALDYTGGFAGNVVRLSAEDGSDTYYLETKEDGFYIKGRDGSFTKIADKSKIGENSYEQLRVIVDLDRGVSRTILNGKDCGTHPLLGSSFRLLSFETTDEDTCTTVVKGGYAEANYAIFEEFTFPTRAIPSDFTNDGALSLVGEYLRLAAGKKTACSFEPLSNKVCFTFSAKPEKNDQNTSWSLCAGDSAVVKLELRNGYLYANGQKIMKTKAQGVLTGTQEQLQNNMWHLIRVEADMATQKAVIKVHTKQVATVDFLTRTSYVDSVLFDNTASAGYVELDDIMVYNLVDYDVPAPQVVQDKYNIGINVCSLWANGSHWGWATITPHDDLKPILGYYDENLTETADWEIKYMTEHGIDFQAFCWYASSGNGALAPNAKHLNRAFVNAKYSDKMKFCLLWEAANGSFPTTVDAFKNYYVPYIIENYFTNPSYMTIDNKPVIAIFGASRIKEHYKNNAETVKGMFDYLRAEAKKVGFSGVIVLDCNSGETKLKDYGFDGWYAYNWGKDYTLELDKAKNLEKQEKVDAYAVPTISVGFNHVGWAQERFPMMSVSDFKAANEWVRDTYLPTYANKSKPGVDGDGHWQENFAMISTWNEYGEGTYIMPSDGLHGFEYLDALREVYSGGVAHTDVKPTAEQKALITHNYPQDIRLLRRNGNDTGLQPQSVKTYTTNFYNDNMAYNMTVLGNGSFKSTTDGPYFILNDENFKGKDASELLRVRVKVSGIPEGQTMQLYYETDKNPRTESNSIKLKSTTNGEQEFVFALCSRPSWIGKMKSLMLKPVDKNDVTFTIESVTLEYGGNYPTVSINGTKLNNQIQTETQNGVDYVPFEPGVSMIHHALSLYFDWSYETKTLTLYRNKHSYQFVVGRDYALVDGKTQVKLGGPVYQRDNIPMLPIEGLAMTLGLHYTKSGKDYRISTQEASYFDSEADGIWTFNRAGDTRGWTMAGGTTSFTNDALVIEGTKTERETYDPRLSRENLNLDCSKYTQIEVCVKWDITGNSNKEKVMKIYYTTTEAPGLSESKTARIPIEKSSNGAFQTLTFNMANTGSWKGFVTQLRFDPFDDAGTTEVKYIRFVEAKEKTVLVEDDAEGAARFRLEPSYAEIVAEPNGVDKGGNSYPVHNKCYYVHGNPDNKGWTTATCLNVNFEAGKTYQISFDVKIADNTKSDSGEILCNAVYKDSASGALDNHIFSHKTVSKKDGWVHYTATYTVKQIASDAAANKFTIYSNPNNEKSVNFYFDNVKVTVVDNGSKQLSSAGIGLTGAAAAAVSGQSAAFLLPTDAESKKSFLNK